MKTINFYQAKARNCCLKSILAAARVAVKKVDKATKKIYFPNINQAYASNRQGGSTDKTAFSLT